MLQYMESEHCWYALDNRPTIYILKSRDFEPKHEISNMRMVKRKETERVLLKELKYRKLICLAFERNLFLVSLGRREIVAHLCGFKTGVTSIAFSECFQVLFVSTFAETFSAYELS